MAAVADVIELQDEVERILRKLTLEETKGIAEHLQIEDIPETETKRGVLRRIQEAFDAAEEETKGALLRGLPIPEPQRESYERVIGPQIVAQHGENDPQVNNPPGDDQIVPHGTVPIQNNVGNGLPDQANLQQNALQNEWFGGAATEWWVVCWYC